VEKKRQLSQRKQLRNKKSLPQPQELRIIANLKMPIWSGKMIDHVSGNKIQLGRPLDFMAVTDHAEYMGVMKQMLDPNNPLAKLEISKNILSDDRAISLTAFGEVGMSMARNQPIEALNKKEINQSTWQKLVAIANEYNQPGKFTTFPAYEWTSSPSEPNFEPPFARNMHRNVIYRGGKVSDLPFSSFNSQDPEDYGDST